MTKLINCQDISIYLGGSCNFNCQYCDRQYIKEHVGVQKFDVDDIPELLKFLNEVDAFFAVDFISFHGGEPFVYVKTMDKIIRAIVDEIGYAFTFFVQTNGSLILQNKEFVEKWKDHLMISISYDFNHQDINRTEIEIFDTLSYLQQCGIKTQLQYVIPSNQSDAFSFDTIRSISHIHNQFPNVTFNLIPLRHIRGKDKFRVILDDVDISQTIKALLQFVEILYILGIDFVIDGHSNEIDKHYFSDHKQIVLSPDGRIYPEYDFLEYKIHQAVIGTWKPTIKLTRTKQEDLMIFERCRTCTSSQSCGLKYLHKEFNVPPGKNCVTFYSMLDVIIQHVNALKTKKNLLQWTHEYLRTNR